MERRKEQLDEVKDAVDVFIETLLDKKIIPDLAALDHIRAELEDFVFNKLEEKRASVLQEVRERIEGQLYEVER